VPAREPVVAASVESPPGQEIVLESKGYIIPARQILVSPKVNGMIVKLQVQEGLRVKKGAVLAELEDIDYKADRDRASALLESARRRLEELQNGFRKEEIRQAREELDESRSQLQQLEAEYKRNKTLREQNVRTAEEYEITESKYLGMKHRIERLTNALALMEQGPRIERIQVAKAEVQQAEAELAKAEWRLSNCTIRAPISGTILKKNAEEGNIVNSIAFNGSFSLCEMADLADLEVDLSIQERDISRIFKGQKCKVRAEAFPDRVYEGEVSRLMPIADRAKGAVPVRVKVAVSPEEEGVYLKPEMGAVVSFLAGKSPAQPAGK
jgi:multidrug resistance efflux pump